jgi:two-component system, sensor histidine kinase and response regulator
VLLLAQREPVGLGRRILIVDDLAVSRTSLARKLNLARFDTVSVGSVEEALEQLAKDTTFDLVLSDELMPMKGGIDLLGLLRADPRYATLPFILLSLFGAEHSQAEWKHRPDAVALKPIRAAALCTLVCQVLSGNPPGRAQMPTALQANQIFRAQRILLVEDNPVNQRVAQRLLQKLAADVTIANHGAEALERLAESTFDAVLMDCQMPVMDGFEATRLIRQSTHARIPIIALTAGAFQEDRDRCLAEMDDYIVKPTTLERLADAVAHSLRASDGDQALPITHTLVKYSCTLT